MKHLIRVASWLVGAGLLALSMWFVNVKPHLDAKLQNPLQNDGRKGQVVSNRVFSVRVDRVDVASAIEFEDALAGTRKMPTPGVFVITYLAVKSNQKPLSLGHIRLMTADGVSYGNSGRVRITTAFNTFEPMLWGHTSYVFEIPKDRLAGIHLILGQDNLLNQLSAEADIDLRIDHASATQMLGNLNDDYKLTSQS